MEKQKTKVQNARYAGELLVKLKRRLINFSVRSQDGQPVGIVHDLGLEVADAKGYFNLIVLQSSAQQGDRLLIISSKHLKNIDIPNRTLFTALNATQIEGLYKYPLPRSADALKVVQQSAQPVRSGGSIPASQNRATSNAAVMRSPQEPPVILLPPIPSDAASRSVERQTAERQTAERQITERQAAERQIAERQYAERQIAERRTIERQPEDQEEHCPETAWQSSANDTVNSPINSPINSTVFRETQSRQQTETEQAETKQTNTSVEAPPQQEQTEVSAVSAQATAQATTQPVEQVADQSADQSAEQVREARSPQRQSSPSLPEIKEPGIKEPEVEASQVEASTVKEHIGTFQLLSERLKVDRGKRKAGEIILRKRIETRMVEVPVRYEKLIVEQLGSKDRPLAEFYVSNGVVSEIKPGDAGSSQTATPVSNPSPLSAPTSSTADSQPLSQTTSQPLVKGVFPSIEAASIVLDTIAQMPRPHCERITVNLWINSKNPEKTSHIFTSPAAANAVLDAIASTLHQQCQKVEIELLLNHPENQGLYQKWFDRYSA